MKRVKYILPIIILLIAVFIGYKELSQSKIDKILKTKEYSYLPKEAKNYIRNIYEKNGVIIHTEKNKEENQPYLSPKYIQYISMSDKEKEKVEVIPDVYAVDFVDSKTVGSSFPSSFDLRDVNGKNFITPLKNQENLSICWSFASIEQAESYLLQKNNTSYSNSFTTLSPRQLDYGTSTNGIKNYENDFGTHGVGDGGNYYMAAFYLASGLSFTSEASMPFNNGTSELELYKVHNYSNSLYELNKSVSLLDYDTSDTEKFNQYINTIKQHVMTYGGAYVATESPDKTCASKMSSNTIIRVDDSCTQDSGHAMQIIGWDDNFSYSYCKTGTKHGTSFGCASNNLVTGTGAWLLRNSWGDNSTYKYVYLAYDSLESDIHVSTDISESSTRNWDNYYHNKVDVNNLYYATSNSSSFTKKINTPEKLEKVKFYSLGYSGNYTVSITSGDKKYNNIKTITSDYPGFNTIDLSDKDIILDQNKFTVTVKSTNNVALMSDQLAVFTSNVSNESIIKTNDVHLNNNRQDYYEFYLNSDTKEVSTNGALAYYLYDSENRNYSSYLTTTDNRLARNNILAHLKLKNTLDDGIYTLKIRYNNKDYDSRIFIGEDYALNGTGTQDDPYVITSYEDLKAINYHLDAYYILNNDIEMQADWIPIGTKDNPFTGSFNGNNHTISNLYISDDYNYAGLFGYVEGNTNNTTTIKNLYIDSPFIQSSGDVGALAGVVNGPQSDSTITIDSIYILNGNIYSTNNSSGSLIGRINGFDAPFGKHTYNINNIFSSADISGIKASGLIGTIMGSDSDNDYKPIVNITNVENLGDITEYILNYGTPINGTKGAFVGTVEGYNNIKLNNYITNTYLWGDSISNTYDNKGLIGNITNTDNLNIYNGYSIYDNVNMSDSTLYDWDGFNTYFKLTTYDGISRMPIIKNVDIEFSEFYNIDIKKDEVIYLSDYLNISYPNNIKLYSLDSTNNIVEINNIDAGGLPNDVEIKALKYGYTTINVINLYDGFRGEINIYVEPENPVNINYHSNNSYDDEYNEIIEKDEDVTVISNPFENSGYRFIEWNTKADGTGTSYQANQVINSVSSDLDLYAIWQPYKYTVKYNANGGAGSIPDQVFYYGDIITIYDNPFTKDNYDFVGWNTANNGSGISYEPFEELDCLDENNDATLILYAQWREQIEFEIDKYEVDDSSNTIDKVDIHTTLDEYLDNFTYGNNYRIEVDLKGKDYISTGSTTKIYKDNNLIRTYTNVVRGDINGDSNISALDYVKVKNHIMGTNIINSFTELLAADANMDDIISALDYVRIKNIIMNGGN